MRNRIRFADTAIRKHSLRNQLTHIFPWSVILDAGLIAFACLLCALNSYGQKTSAASSAAQVKAGAQSGEDVEASRSTVNAASADVLKSSSKDARIDDIDGANGTVKLTVCDSECGGPQLSLKANSDVASSLKSLQAADRVTFTTGTASILESIKLSGRPVDQTTRAEVLCVTLVLCLFLAALLTWWHPLKLVVGEDSRYSNSKLQMAVWFCLVIASYLSVVYLRVSRLGWSFFDSVNIPSNLLLLSGMSALTFAGAKGITTSKVDAATAAGNPNPKPAGQPHFLKDLTQNDSGLFDLGDFQMLVVTILAVGMYIVSVFHFLGLLQATSPAALPDVDTTILATFGLGQGAYLTKKAVGSVRDT